MTSAQHKKWTSSGLNWQLARPLAYMRNQLRSYGYTIYDIGNNAHLDHIPPEDHTPYSETGWPLTTPYGWVTAIDIMPPSGGLPSLQALGAQIYADRQVGKAGFIKYMNWGPVDNRHAVQDEWIGDHSRRTSSDAGHIHMSCRSDAINDLERYDPVARLRGESSAKPLTLEDTMNIIGTPNGARFLQTNAGPVAITWDEWTASFGTDKDGWPPVLLVANDERVRDFCPVVKTDVASKVNLSDVTVTGTLQFPGQ